MNPWPRQFTFRVVLVFVALAAALIVHVPRVEKMIGLRDSVNDHRTLLSKGHASFTCEVCHISHAAKAQRPLWQTRGVDAAVFARDSEAAGGIKTGLCMSCHDGTVASASSSHFGGAASGGARVLSSSGWDPNANHPVGVDYRAAVRRDPSSYNDPVMNARIVLEDGKVGCISCHATHDLSEVSAGNVRHEVCTDCHIR